MSDRPPGDAGVRLPASSWPISWCRPGSRVPHVLLDDAALLVQQEAGRGQAHIPKRLAASPLRSSATRKGRPASGQSWRRSPGCRSSSRWPGLVALALELLVGAHQLGHLVHAGCAAGGPEVHQRHLAAQARQRLLAPSSRVRVTSGWLRGAAAASPPRPRVASDQTGGEGEVLTAAHGRAQGAESRSVRPWPGASEAAGVFGLQQARQALASASRPIRPGWLWAGWPSSQCSPRAEISTQTCRGAWARSRARRPACARRPGWPRTARHGA
jgi:hypothetical protein